MNINWNYIAVVGFLGVLAVLAEHCHLLAVCF